jgi:hypothetical protein
LRHALANNSQLDSWQKRILTWMFGSALARWSRCTLVMALAGCGPGLGRHDTDASAEETGAVASTGATPPPAATSTSGPSAPTGTTTGTTTGSDGDPTDITAASFICSCDASPPRACDVIAQDCPRGFKCTLWADDGGTELNASRCALLPVDPVAPGDSCTAEGSGQSGVDNCELGSMCWSVDAQLQGTCVEFCGGTWETPECGAAATCLMSNGGLPALCVADCNPLVPTCAETEGCYPYGDAFVCNHSTADPEASHGSPCELAFECPEGLQCVPAAVHSSCDGVACCSTHCDLSDPTADAQCGALDPGQVCRPWYAPAAAPRGYEDVGICGV